MAQYDVCIIGGGPSGFAAAFRALDYGRSVLLIEKDRLGGRGVFNGSLSSKTLWELARDFSKLGITNRGYQVTSYNLSYREIMREEQAAVQQRYGQLMQQVRCYEEQLGSGQFHYAEGFGRLTSPNDITVTHSDGSQSHYSAAYILLATGSRPRTLPNIPVDEATILTSDGLGNLTEFPQSMVILGAGVIGCEFATIFSKFEQTQVSLIDKADRVLPFEDQDISETVARNLEGLGVHIHRTARMTDMQIEDGQVRYDLVYPDGSTSSHYVEKALISIGRVPNVEGLGAEEVGLELTDRGHFVVDDSQTNIPNIYAIGDLTADINLVSIAETEGRHAIKCIFDPANTRPMTYENVSSIMFLDPEVAGVGMNEQQAQAAGMAYRVASYSYEFINRAICMRCRDGFFKILVTDDDEMRLLGMRAIGPHASSAIQTVALLINMGKGIRELAELIHPHPSIVEGMQECVRMLLGKSIMKPHVFNQSLRCCRVVNGEARALTGAQVENLS